MLNQIILILSNLNQKRLRFFSCIMPEEGVLHFVIETLMFNLRHQDFCNTEITGHMTILIVCLEL